MAQHTPAQLEELDELTTGMLDTIRRVIRDEPADAQEFLGQMYQLMQVHGTAGFSHAVRAWLDAAVAAFPHVEPGQVQGVAFTNETGDSFDDLGSMSHEYRWAAACLTARVRNDQAALYELIGAVPADLASVYLLRAAELVGGVLNDKDTGRGASLMHTGDVLLVQLDDG